MQLHQSKTCLLAGYSFIFNYSQMQIDLMQELENLQKTLEDRIDSRINPIKDSLDKNQKFVDKLAKAKDIDLPEEENSFATELQKSYEKNYDEVQKLLRDKNPAQRVTMELSQKAMTTIATSGITGTANVITSSTGNIYDLGSVPRIRDFVSLGTMDKSRATFLLEGAMVGAPATVAEGALKPEVEIRLSEGVAESQYIAGWTNLSTKFFDDTPNLPTFLNQRLMEALMVAESSQLISGTGVSPQIKGIGTAGNFTAATDLAAVDDMLQLIGGIRQLAENNHGATGILLSISDYFRLIGSQTENAGLKVVGVNAQGRLTILGVPAAWSPAIATGTYYVIDKSGLTLLFREAPRVELFYEDSDNCRRNSVTVRIEERVAFLVGAATYVIKGTF
jgi:HK97 family phage major capsid protein